MNATILALLTNVPGIIEWVISEEPKVMALVADAKALIADAVAKGTSPASAQASGGLALLGQLLAHAATTFTPATTPAVTPPK